MPHFKRILSLCIALLLLFQVLPCVSASPEIDPEQSGSISIQISYAGKPVSGGSITLYHVATLGADATFVPVPEFAGCDVDLNGTLTATAARKLANHAYAHAVPGTDADLGDDGHASFQDLKAGLYLIVQKEPAEGYLSFNPVVIGIPTVIGESCYYDVDASPKVAPEPAPTDPTSPTKPDDPTTPTTPKPPKPPRLPQTGQLNWPIPVLAICGLTLMIMGLYLCFGRRKRHDQA